jgi:hypothetical protein
MRLTADEIRAYKGQLSGWLPPAQMRLHSNALMDRLGSEHLFAQPGIEFVREAWVAAEFGEQRSACAVRLILKERPDFGLRFDDGEIESYELVEVDRPDRRRGEEYAALAAAGFPPYNWPVEEWATAEEAFRSVRMRSEIKSKRAATLATKGTPYPEGTRLLFYVNLCDFGAHTREIENVFSVAVEPVRKWFSSIWILWRNRVYRA